MSVQMSVNGGEGHDQALVPLPQPAVEVPSVSEGVGVVEADSIVLAPQIPETGIPSVQGPYPVLHLHRHIHAGVVDDEARSMITRLAEQHGEVFTYLHDQVGRAQESLLQRLQFEKDIVAWVRTTQEVLESQWLRAERMSTGLFDVQETIRAVRREVTGLSEHLTTRTTSIEAQIQDLSAQVHAELLDSGKMGSRRHGCVNSSEKSWLL